MTTISNTDPNVTYASLLTVGVTGTGSSVVASGLTGTIQLVQDALGNSSVLGLSTNQVNCANIKFNSNTISTTSGAITVNSTSGALNFGTQTASTVTIGNATGTVVLNGTVTFGGSFSVTNLSLSGNLSVTGTSTLTGNTTVGGTLGVTGLATLGSASVTTTLAVTGAATFGSTLAATTSISTGNLTLAGNTVSSTNSNGNIILTPNGTGKIQTSAGLADTNGNLYLSGVATASAVNYLNVINAASGDSPTIQPGSGSTNVGLKVLAKGSQGVQIGSPTGTTALGVLYNNQLQNHTAALTGTRTVTWPDANVTLGTFGASATTAGAQSLSSSGSFSYVALTTIEWTDGNFDNTVSLYGYTVPANGAGKYLVTVSSLSQSLGGFTGYLSLRIFLNSTTAVRTVSTPWTYSTSSLFVGPSVSAILNLSAGNTIQATMSQVNSGGGSIGVDVGLSIMRLGT